VQTITKAYYQLKLNSMKKIILFYCLAFSVWAMGQTAADCGGALSSSNISPFIPNITPALSSCSTPSFNFDTDAASTQFVPNASMPTLQFRVNFVFLIHPTQPTIFTGKTPSQITADANAYVNLMNAWFQTCGSIPSNLTPINPSALVPNPKIQLVLNNVYFDTTNAAISHLFLNSNLDTQFPHDLNNSLNIYFYTESVNGSAGAGWAEFGRFCAMALGKPSIGGVYTPVTIQNNPRLTWHELCHAFGFLGDHYTAQPNNSDPVNGYYIPDDATVDPPTPYNCTIPTGIPNKKWIKIY
jgi:hypothetical protein